MFYLFSFWIQSSWKSKSDLLNQNYCLISCDSQLLDREFGDNRQSSFFFFRDTHFRDKISQPNQDFYQIYCNKHIRKTIQMGIHKMCLKKKKNRLNHFLESIKKTHLIKTSINFPVINYEHIHSKRHLKESLSNLKKMKMPISQTSISET